MPFCGYRRQVKIICDVPGAGGGWGRSASFKSKLCSTLQQASASSAFPSTQTTVTEVASAEESAWLVGVWALRSHAHQKQAVPNQSWRLPTLEYISPCNPCAVAVLKQHGQSALWCRGLNWSCRVWGRGWDSVKSGPCLNTAAVILADYFCLWLLQAQAINLLWLV